MHLHFRQGLISFQAGAFLLPSSTPGYVDISVSPTPLIGTIAHGTSDYLLKFDASVPAAWGPMTAGFDNYLFIELNLITGALTYGITTREPIVATTEPTGVVPGQMWFDLVAKVFKVRTNDNAKWIPVPRLVVGYVENGNVNQLRPYMQGSSVGLNEPGHPGYLMLDSQLRPLRTSLGELLTQDTPVRVKTTVGTSGVLSSPINGFVPVRANEAIPPMRLVYFSGADAVSLASSDPALLISKTPIGIVEGGLGMNEVGVVTQSGEITYDQWDWQPADIGKPLYCGFNGELTTTRPSSVQAYRVGYIKNNTSILFYIDSETQQQVLATAGSIISGVPPITATTSVNGLGEIVTSVAMLEANGTRDGYLSSANFTVFNSLSGRMTAAEGEIDDLQMNKADIGHVHVIADTTGLQSALNLLTTNVGLKADRIVPASVGNFPGLNALGNLTDSGFGPSSFALSSHVHLISEVTNLQTELNNRALLGHVHAIADTTGLQAALNNKADFNHTHTIANVTNLQTTLDGKAPVSHGHNIIDVSGLQEALELRSLLGHTHTISEVLNLQTTLNGKADVLHTHAIADITNLQSSLDSKADIVHSHVAADVTDFGETVDDRVASLLQAGAGITLQYLDGGNQLVIASSAVGAPPLLVTGFSALGAAQTNWSSSSVSFGTAFVAATSGTGTPASPGSVTLSLKPLQFFEGPTLRSTYPNPAPGNVQTSIVFGSGLAATVSGASSEILTVSSVAASALDGLDDVVLTAPTSGQVLSYNGTDWVNTASSGGGFMFQVGASMNTDHYHYAMLSMADAQMLVQTTTPLLPVGDVGQPSVVITSADNGNSTTHSHNLTVMFDYTNHKFVVTAISNNPFGFDTPHVAWMIGDTVPTPGAAYDVLTSDGPNAEPYWSAPSGGSSLIQTEEIVISGPISQYHFQIAFFSAFSTSPEYGALSADGLSYVSVGALPTTPVEVFNSFGEHSTEPTTWNGVSMSGPGLGGKYTVQPRIRFSNGFDPVPYGTTVTSSSYTVTGTPNLVQLTAFVPGITNDRVYLRESVFTPGGAVGGDNKAFVAVFSIGPSASTGELYRVTSTLQGNVESSPTFTIQRLSVGDNATYGITPRV